MQLKSEPNRLSPLHIQHQSMNARFNVQAGWMIPEVYTTLAEEAAALQENVGLADISARGKLILKGLDTGGIITSRVWESPTQSGDVIEIESNHLLIAKSTNDELIILTAPGVEQEIETSLEAEISSQNMFASVINQTSGLAGFLISGPKSIGVMSKLCALDFNQTDFPNLHVAQSSFAKVRGTIIRHDRNDQPAFELYADRSYADYLWSTILDAGSEFSIKPVGWNAINIALG